MEGDNDNGRKDSNNKPTVAVKDPRPQSSTTSRFPALQRSWPFPNLEKPHRFWYLRSKVTVFMVGWLGKIFLTRFTRTKVINKETAVSAIFRRREGVPLITVANHESCVDDPSIITMLMTNRELADQRKMRWGLAAHDICFTKKWHSLLFSHGKCIPTVRGLGVYQRALDFAIDRLNHGEWVHVFPEGKVNTEKKELYRLKWGIGRIISETKKTPIVIPIWHVGMSDVLPNTKPYFLRIGKSVLINVGQPLQLDEVIEAAKKLPSLDRRKMITDFIQSEMMKLREKTLELKQDIINKKHLD